MTMRDCVSPNRRASRRTAGGSAESAADCAEALVKLVFDLEVPEPKHGPPGFSKGGIRKAVALLRPLDLRIPVRARLSRREVVGMPVPEPAVHENGHAPPRESQIRLAREGLCVNAPSARPVGPQGAPQGEDLLIERAG